MRFAKLVSADSKGRARQMRGYDPVEVARIKWSFDLDLIVHGLPLVGIGVYDRGPMDRELKIMLLDIKAEVEKLRLEVMWLRNDLQARPKDEPEDLIQEIDIPDDIAKLLKP